MNEKRKDRRFYSVHLFDGLGEAYVYVVDGYGRHIGNPVRVVGVHTVSEAISAAKAEISR